jgi:hypothetical protein
MYAFSADWNRESTEVPMPVYDHSYESKRRPDVGKNKSFEIRLSKAVKFRYWALP